MGGEVGDTNRELVLLQGQLDAALNQLQVERAAAAAEQARLTYELGHRVRNTLSVVQALATQTMRGTMSREDVVDVFARRVLALARANDVILERGWTTATIRTVADSILAPLGFGSDRLALQGPELHVGASAALSLAMALNELASNAKRYGAWSAPGGQVRLVWSIDAEAAPPALALIWAESDGPAVAAPVQRGFGLKLIEQSLRSAFGRQVRMDFAPTGLVCTARSPVPDPSRDASGAGATMTEAAIGPRAWQRMLSGRRLDLLHPAPGDIEIEDLAHGLARVARWNGQTRGTSIFSVAQHSVLVERIAVDIHAGVTATESLAALLHDGPEYVVGDMISPFKAVLGEDYKAVESRLLDAIHLRFALPVSSSALVARIKAADRIAAYIEATQLAGFAEDEARIVFGHPPGLDSIRVPTLSPLSSTEAEAAFLHRFATLQDARREDAR